jgi:hypothetical protein
MPTIDPDPTAASLAAGVALLALPGLRERTGDPSLDQFARRAGPDVAIGSGSSIVRAYAIFSLDPETKELRVRVVDDAGRLIRAIPPESVGQMIAAMGKYLR